MFIMHFTLFPDTRLLVSFSLARNWYRLIGEENDEIARDLRPFNAVRFIFMYCVMMAHIGVFTSVSPTINPEWMEDVSDLEYHKIQNRIIFIH